ncbi:hypothetical protein [Sphingobacterium suaedae]|uniref:Uncharacterized protein n=1 Tax=Sphingobacterium suaedae TaxID=1686402 RepID=A0ABW5KDC9_9SPHI
MAKSRENIVMQGARGITGRILVFRQRGDQTVIARRPRRKDAKAPSDKQVEVQNKFVDASMYARTAIADPVLKAAYEAKATINLSVFTWYLKISSMHRLEERLAQHIGGAGAKRLFLPVAEFVDYTTSRFFVT